MNQQLVRTVGDMQLEKYDGNTTLMQGKEL